MSTSTSESIKIIYDNLGQEFCYIPRRPFLFSRNNVVTQLVGPLYMAKYTVTNIQFKHFVKESGYDYSAFDIMDQVSPEVGCPAAPVSWQDAKAYARWLRNLTGAYYSLPSEEEWEISARGLDGRYYPWGNTPPTDLHGTFSLRVHRRQTNVCGRFPMNISYFGCVDMVGNIWEWCIDALDDSNEAHPLRGGSCRDDETICNNLCRRIEAPSQKRVLYAGFRLVYLTGEMYERYKQIYAQKALKKGVR
jgi:formylglycine-generating enzyme required for sulfatase activity